MKHFFFIFSLLFIFGCDSSAVDGEFSFEGVIIEEGNIFYLKSTSKDTPYTFTIEIQKEGEASYTILKPAMPGEKVKLIGNTQNPSVKVVGMMDLKHLKSLNL